jgi:hypothetical protein
MRLLLHNVNRAYITARLLEDHVLVSIDRSRTNEWKTTWQKFLIEMAYQSRYYALFPNYKEQLSLAVVRATADTSLAGLKPDSISDSAADAAAEGTVPLMQEQHSVLSGSMIGLGVHASSSSSSSTSSSLPSANMLQRMDIFDRFVDELPPLAAAG